MKNIIRNIFVGGITAALLASCNLDLVPTTSITFKEGDPLILTEADIDEFQNGVLASYRALQYGQNYQTVEVMTECFNATVDYGNNYGFTHRLGDGFLSNNEYVTSIWANHYAAIKNYNVAIEQCGYVEDEALMPYAEVLKGISLFCRASSYLTLARAFSADYDPATAATEPCVPLILVYDQNEVPVRATVQDVYDQIITDLEDAEEILAAASAAGMRVNSTNLAGQAKALVPTVDAVRALKARYYLDTHDYDNAVSQAEAVIGSAAGYVLSSSVDEMVNEFMNDEGKESLIRLYASKTEGAVGCTIYTGVMSTSEEGKFFEPLYIPSQTIIDAYDDSDLRKQVWFPLDYYPVKIQGTLNYGLHMFIKYLGCPALQTGKDENGAHYAKPLMIAEMYLIAAEAYAQNQEYADAKAVLNALQAARNAKLTDGSMESVKKEWMRETVGDGQRINCIKRWGDGLPARPCQSAAEFIVMNTPVSDYTGRTLDASSHTLVWPIPSYEIKIAPELEQNPGYAVE